MKKTYKDVLRSYNTVRDILAGASDKTWFFYRKLFCHRWVYSVHRIKIDYKKDFFNILELWPQILQFLEIGNTYYFEKIVVPELIFDTFERTIVSLAFVAFLIDRWKEQGIFSWDYIIETAALQVWQAFMRMLWRENLL
ncbi:small T-antigen [Bat mastadenovirus WIV12]|uniref:E1B protein, small T-antigen n=1 Tax=Bat mastadenovirus WIV12 TaxID=1788434 RepID=A0A1B0UI04_9ADEN|nr:small T-antigen [Bat mastadenovirus WIV12]AMB43144.1 small T-antigen [Bat mastadenovirus WIV12]